MPPTLEEARNGIQLAHIDNPDYAEGIIKCLRRFNETQLYEKTKDDLTRYGYSDEQIRVAGVWYKRMKGVKI